MPIQFFQSGYGRTFYEGQLPAAIRAANRIADALERIADSLEKDNPDLPEKQPEDTGNE